VEKSCACLVVASVCLWVIARKRRNQSSQGVSYRYHQRLFSVETRSRSVKSFQIIIWLQLQPKLSNEEISHCHAGRKLCNSQFTDVTAPFNHSMSISKDQLKFGRGASYKSTWQRPRSASERQSVLIACPVVRFSLRTIVLLSALITHSVRRGLNWVCSVVSTTTLHMFVITEWLRDLNKRDSSGRLD